MSGLKAQQRQLRKQAKALAKGSTSIPRTVTNLPAGLSEHLGEKFRLIFEYYNHSQCKMIRMSKEEMKRVINTFAKITKHDQTNISKLCRPDPIKRASAGKAYKDLFVGLPEDFDILLEVDFTGGGRIFIYPYQNMCLVISIDKTHR